MMQVGAIEDDEKMTPLGYHLAKLPVDVLIGKVFIPIPSLDLFEKVARKVLSKSSLSATKVKYFLTFYFLGLSLIHLLILFLQSVEQNKYKRFSCLSSTC